MLFNDLKYAKIFFCSNGYSNAIFTILFHESQVEELRKVNKKFKKIRKSANDFFITVLLFSYDLKYQNSTKNGFSNPKSGMVPKVTLTLN